MRTLAITFLIIGSILLTMSMHANRNQEPKVEMTIPAYERPKLKFSSAENELLATAHPLDKIITEENIETLARSDDAVININKPNLTIADSITRRQITSEETYCPMINETYASIAAQAGISEESLRQHNGVGTHQGLALGKPIRLPLGSVPSAEWTSPINTTNLSYEVQVASG